MNDRRESETSKEHLSDSYTKILKKYTKLMKATSFSDTLIMCWHKYVQQFMKFVTEYNSIFYTCYPILTIGLIWIVSKSNLYFPEVTTSLKEMYK